MNIQYIIWNVNKYDVGTDKALFVWRILQNYVMEINIKKKLG